MNNISSFCIRRPVFTIVLSLVLVLFGVIGYTFLSVREYPSIDPPIITVQTSYVGANADIIESQITEPLEASINGIDGIRTITSSSNQGSSSIVVEFNLGADLEAAANDVRDRVSRVIRQLPADLTTPPVVSKADANSDAILALTLQSSVRDHLQVSYYAENVLKEQLQTIPGVSIIYIWGQKRYSMRVWMDPARLAAYQLTPLDVRNAIQKENVELPSGKIQGNTTELTIRTKGNLSSPDEYNNLIIRSSSQGEVRLRDIGYAALEAENQESVLKESGVPMIGLAIVPQPGSNYVDISDEFYRRLDLIRQNLPEDFSINISVDNTRFIRNSISQVQETIFIAFLLVVLIIFVFLRDWRSTLIPVIAIPISLISTFFVMYIAGYSINVLTLLGVVLATGLVVDDAIVMLENIYQKVEKGVHPLEASFKGSSEIVFAIISTTITLVAVYFPIIFLQGFTGRLFREFGVVIATSVTVSSFVSLTLTPMMCARVLRPPKSMGRFFQYTEKVLNSMRDSYERSLTAFMTKKWWALVIVGASVGLIFWLGSILPSELAPLEDRSALRVSAIAPEGASFEYMDAYMDRMVAKVRETVPESEIVLGVTAPGFLGSGGLNTGFIRLRLVEPHLRGRSQQEIASALTRDLAAFPEGRAMVIQDISMGAGSGRGGLPVQFVLQAQNFESLREKLPVFLQEANQNPAFSVVDVNLKFNKPELEVEISREKARDMGISVLDVAQTLQLSMSPQRLGYFTLEGKQYQIIGQFSRQFRDKPVDLASIYLRSANGEMVQVDNLVQVTEKSSPPQLYHFNRYKSATVSAGLADGYTIADGIKAMEEIAGRVLDDSFNTSLTGPARDYDESASNMVFAFLLALLLVYLVLSAQFESFRDPLIIMVTVPLALAGALFSLWYFSQTMNIFSQIGIIMLIGLVTKNGILIVEFANQRKAEGIYKHEAVIRAAVSRFRPILMTSLATVLGALPIALSLGAGSESRVSMGIVVIGGLIFSLVLTLYVIPAMYSYISGKTTNK